MCAKTFIWRVFISSWRKSKKKSHRSVDITSHNVGKAQVHAPTIIYRTYTQDDFRFASFTNVPQHRARIVTLYLYIYIHIYIYTFIDDRNSPRIVEGRGYNDLYSKIIPSRFVALRLKCYPSIILRKYYREQLLIQSTRRSCAHPGTEFE